MNFLFDIIRQKWAATLGVVLAISVFIWYMGPYIAFRDVAPLRPQDTRIICILVLLAVWALYTLFRKWRSKKNNEELLDSLADDSGVGEAQAAEAEALQEKMQDAVAVLKSKDFSKTGGKKFIYELPWYLIIGPPGAGKTTLLANSGLNFPLEESHGKYSVKGVGGTRNCDWWFTDQAVMLDTAGRYTTQDSDSEIDKKAWENFLQLLKDNRKRRPINGMFIALALHDIVNQSEDELIQMAKTIRFRMDEIHDKFGMRPPVYLIITKSDLLAGFGDFFGSFDTDARNQVWGFTVSATEKGEFSAQTKEQFEQLKSRLYGQLTTKLANESSQPRRDQIYGFPMQFAAIQNKLQQFVGQFSAESRLQNNVYLRGIYFTSATQDGSALDQVVSSVSRSFGFTGAAVQRTNTAGKSYFINNLLTDVVFKESGLAGTNLGAEKRANRLQVFSMAAIALATIGLIGLWGLSTQRNNAMMDSIDNNSEKLAQDLAQISPENLDLMQVSSMLTNTQNLNTTPDNSGFLLKRTGLYQGGKIGTHANRKYDEFLTDALLSRLMVRLEHQMHSDSDNSEFLFEALKTYQMLDNPDKYKADDIIGWFRFDYDQNLPVTTSTADKNALISHTENLFSSKPPQLPRPLDRALIARYQQVAANTPYEQRAYFRLKQQHADLVNTPLRLTSVSDGDLARALELSGDKTFNTFIPEFFTVDGYQSRFLPSINKVSETLANDTWVLGPYAAAITATDTSALEKSVTSQYHSEYIAVWQNLLDDLTLRSPGTLVELTNFLSLVTDPESPLKNLFVTVKEQTTLTIPKPADTKDAQAEENSRQENLANLIGGNSNTQATVIEIDPVTTHFKPVHDLLENWETNGSKLDTVLQQMSDLNLQLLPLATNPGAASDMRLAGELAVKIRQLTTKAERLPPAVAKLVSSLTNDVNDVSSGGFCATLNTIWQADVYPFYRTAIMNRYPISKRASNEIALEDFGKFFGPGGIIDSFVTENLGSNVQKTPGKWTWVGSGNAQCVSDNALRQLALADEIRQSFFSSQSSTPSFSFNLNSSTLSVDKSIYNLYLTIGDRNTEFFHGPLKGGSSFVWPGDGGSTEATLRVEPIIAGTLSRISLHGPWAILRLLDSGQLRQKNKSDITVDYSFGGRPVQMEFNASSYNPLNSRALRQFRSPGSL